MDTNLFWSKVDKRQDGCWLWTGAKTYDGYGVILVKSAHGKQTTICVHRWVWEQDNGPIPKGYHLDHLCKVRACVNPHHLEIVTPRENVLRSNRFRPVAAGFCRQGHDLAIDGNSDIDDRGKVRCRICYLASLEPWRIKQRETKKKWRARRQLLKVSENLA